MKALLTSPDNLLLHCYHKNLLNIEQLADDLWCSAAFIESKVDVAVLNNLFSTVADLKHKDELIDQQDDDDEYMEWADIPERFQHPNKNSTWQISDIGTLRLKTETVTETGIHLVQYKAYMGSYRADKLSFNGLGKGKNLGTSAAQLVAMCFISNPHDYKYVKHLDFDLGNCDVLNLHWVERQIDTYAAKYVVENEISGEQWLCANSREFIRYVFDKKVKPVKNKAGVTYYKGWMFYPIAEVIDPPVLWFHDHVEKCRKLSSTCKFTIEHINGEIKTTTDLDKFCHAHQLEKYLLLESSSKSDAYKYHSSYMLSEDKKIGFHRGYRIVHTEFVTAEHFQKTSFAEFGYITEKITYKKCWAVIAERYQTYSYLFISLVADYCARHQVSPFIIDYKQIKQANRGANFLRSFMRPDSNDKGAM